MNIIVNGGTRGIGREVVLKMAQDINNQILVTGRNEVSLNSLKNMFSNVYSMPIDFSVFDKYSEIYRDTIFSYFRVVDIVINMTGSLISREFIDFTDKEARTLMETNFLGPASAIRIIKPLMQRGSHIINISSMGGFQGSSKYNGLSYYSASKAALACLSECLATEFQKSGISVNCLALGAVQTEMLGEAFPGYNAPVEAKDMAEFICDFAKNGNKFINGKILPVAINNP